MPDRKPDPKKDIKGKGRARGRLDRGEDFENDDEDAENDSIAEEATAELRENGSTSQIRELRDEDDETAFIADDTQSEEEKQLIELRSTLWGNVSACEMRLVSLAFNLLCPSR